MLDWWAAGEYDSVDTYLLAPAIVGYKQKQAPFWPTGRCTFLTEQNLCELHDKGLKPTEGRLAIHSTNHEEGDGLHKQVAMTWKSKQGEALIRRWKQK